MDNSPATQASASSKHSDQDSTTEEDWDRVDSASDLEHAANALAVDGSATVKGGRSPYLQDQEPQSGTRPITPKIGPSASRPSIFGGGDPSPQSSQPTRFTRLSNVEENAEDHREEVQPQGLYDEAPDFIAMSSYKIYVSTSYFFTLGESLMNNAFRVILLDSEPSSSSAPLPIFYLRLPNSVGGPIDALSTCSP